MLSLVLLFLATLFLAYANGSNDNVKGVATLYGSGAATYQQALAIGTLATAAGGLLAIFIATNLVQSFSGRGLLPNEFASAPAFAVSVAIGAASTVLLATWRGLPISTTHALVGAIIGAGLMAAGSRLNFAVLGKVFIAPLLLGPLLAVAASVAVYATLHALRVRMGIERELCVCIGESLVPVSQLPAGAAGTDRADAAMVGVLAPAIDTSEHCVERYSNRFVGVTVHQAVLFFHNLSSAAVSMARGMNDVPKLVALLAVVKTMDIRYGYVAAIAAMSIGGLLNGHKVARTMGKNISTMNDGQAVSANLVTALLVIPATSLGLPLSTTHVSTGSIAGVGLVSKTLNAGVLRNVVLAWVATLPIAAVISASAYLLATA